MDTLGTIAIDLGINESPLRVGLQRAMSQSQSGGARAGGLWGSQFASAMSQKLGGINLQGIGGGLLSGLLSGGAGIGLADISRRALAASGTITQYGNALRAIEPSADKANAAVKELLDLGTRTGLGGDVLEFATRLADRSGDVGGAVISAKKQINALAALRTNPAEFKELQTNLGQIFNRGDKKVEAEDFQQLRDRAPLLFTEAAKALGVSAKQAEQKVRNMTGNEFQALFEKIGEANQGMAEKLAGNTIPGAMKKIENAFFVGLAPSVRAVERLVLPVAGAIGTAAEQFGKLNEATGGAAGIAGLAGVAALGIRSGKNALQNGLPLPGLAGGMGLSGMTVRATTVYVSGGVVPGAGPAGQTIMPGAPGATGTGSKIGNFMRGPGGSITAIGLGLGAAAAGEKLGSQSGFFSQFFGAMLKGAGTGAALGVPFGGPIGGGIGGVVGGAGAGYQFLAENSPKNPLLNLFGLLGIGTYAKNMLTPDAKKPESEKRNETVEALKENTRALRDVNVQVLGGGERTERAASRLAGEFAMSRFLAGIA